MAYEPIIKDQEDTPPEPAKPDPMDAVNAQLAAMREQINSAYQMNKGIQQSQPQVQYVPYPAYPQQEEQPLNESDILADLPGTLDRVRQETAEEVEQRLREEMGQHLGRIYEKDFERDMTALAGDPHYKFVEEDLKRYFADNPNEKYQPGRLMEKYHSLVGSKITEIRDAEAKEREANEPAPIRSVEHSIPVSSSPRPQGAASPQEEVTLSEREEQERQIWNRSQGLSMSAKEWAAWRDGELGPRDGYED